ncbi:MAG: tRNA 2-thiouridine(34) synthase MnmA [Oscillospiraceae bacterium]|nr:tRNA 2-thiouridine(34) synthase MnmA [Oscillospiraceae bacterium]
MKKILVALSGGVDSAAACILLQRQGYEIGGATMLLRDGGEGEAEDARRAARSLGIEFHCFDMRQEFRDIVIEDFKQVYVSGGTPNPCVLCNRKMKFGLFLNKALELGYDGIATGHYARLRQEGSRTLLVRAADLAKDQTYMLCGLNQWQLAHSLFPLGDVMSKDETRQLATEAGLDVARKRDSQDICFVPDGDYMKYLTENGLVPQEGNFITPEGQILGKHRGLEAYTVGQRRGLGMAFGQRAYVLGKRGTDVLIGDNEQLFSDTVQVEQVNFIPFDRLTQPIRVEAKLRYSAKSAPAMLLPRDNGCELIFEQPQRAVTPGQTAVFYDGDTVIGGGIIKG